MQGFEVSGLKIRSEAFLGECRAVPSKTFAGILVDGTSNVPTALTFVGCVSITLGPSQANECCIVRRTSSVQKQ